MIRVLLLTSAETTANCFTSGKTPYEPRLSPVSAFSVQTVNLMKKEKRREGKKKISLEKQSFSQKEISAADFFCTRVEWKRKIDSPECQVLPYDETK